MVGLGDLSGGEFDSYATGISANGTVIAGGGMSDLGPEAFRWTAETGIAPLGDLPGGFFGSGASAISSDGATIVGYSNSEISGGSIEAFRWTSQTGMQPLGDLAGGDFESDAIGVNGDGSLIVGFSAGDKGMGAFVWDEQHGMRDLQDLLVSGFALGPQLGGWHLASATDISDDGRTIVGYGLNPDGHFEAWLVRLDHPLNTPEPPTAGLLAFAATAIAACRGRCLSKAADL
jgi:probable HAF family extracellular repeat protein